MTLFAWIVVGWLAASVLVTAGWMIRMRFEPDSHAEMRMDRDYWQRHASELEMTVAAMSDRTAAAIDEAIEKLLEGP